MLFEAANWAPNHGKTEPWRFAVLPNSQVSQFVDIMTEHTKKSVSDPKVLEKKLKKVRVLPLAVLLCVAPQRMMSLTPRPNDYYHSFKRNAKDGQNATTSFSSA